MFRNEGDTNYSNEVLVGFVLLPWWKFCHGKKNSSFTMHMTRLRDSCTKVFFLLGTQGDSWISLSSFYAPSEIIWKYFKRLDFQTEIYLRTVASKPYWSSGNFSLINIFISPCPSGWDKVRDGVGLFSSCACNSNDQSGSDTTVESTEVPPSTS